MTDTTNQSMPWAGMQFFDNAGHPLANGYVYSYGAGGFQKQALYPTADAVDPLTPNPFPLNQYGRMVPEFYGETQAMRPGHAYRFVTKSVDGVVTQELSDVYVPELLPGDNISFVKRDFSYNKLQIESSTTDPLFDQGDVYVFKLTSVQNSVFDGSTNNVFNIVQTTPRSSSKPVVTWNSLINRFVFLFSGAYQIRTILTFNALAGWPNDVTVFGRTLQRSSDAGPIDTSYSTNYAILGNQQTSTDMFVISAEQNLQMAIDYYALSAGSSLKYSVTAVIEITRIGEAFTQVISPPVTSFIAVPEVGYSPLDVTFTDTSSNAPTSWAWNFGDGGTSTLQNPVHTYATNGVFDASLTASNIYGSGLPFIQPIVVTESPVGTIILFDFETSFTDMATVNTIDRTFAVTAGQTIVCCTQGLAGTGTGFDTYIRLYDETNTEVALNDDAAPPNDTPNIYASYLSYVATTSGTYRFAVGGYALSYVMGTAGYQIT